MGIKKSTHRSVSLLLVIVLMVGTIFLNDGSVLAESGDPDTTPQALQRDILRLVLLNQLGLKQCHCQFIVF